MPRNLVGTAPYAVIVLSHLSLRLPVKIDWNRNFPFTRRKNNNHLTIIDSQLQGSKSGGGAAGNDYILWKKINLKLFEVFFVVVIISEIARLWRIYDNRENFFVVGGEEKQMWAVVAIIVSVLVVDLCVTGIYKALGRKSSKNSSNR